MIPAILLLACPIPTEPPARVPDEVVHVAPAACAPRSVVRSTWLAERSGESRTITEDGATRVAPFQEERRIERALEVLECRAGVPQRLRLSYGEAFTRRLAAEQAPEGGSADAPSFAHERSPLAGRSFDLVQVGESATVRFAEGSPAPAGMAAIVLAAESIRGGAVPLPGDELARALGAAPRAKGATFEVDPLVACELLGGGEEAASSAAFTFLGLQQSAQGASQARFEVRIEIRAQGQDGSSRLADLRGFLLADPGNGRPLELEVQGFERQRPAPARGAPRVETDVTWRVLRTWTWR
ncbi:MAG: hypothetical protein JNK02_08545 [Planctomycetes bacterium]|nr:hypothetical protein [Planctomycetota bacterium]